ncbi:PrsW family glutamic-type intramembrane protease [Deinococcus sp. PESE-13]
MNDIPSRPPGPAEPETAPSVSDGISPVTPQRTERPLQNLIDDFKGLPFDVLFPVQRWLGDRPWKMRWVQALLFFSLFPLLLSKLWGSEAAIENTAWALGSYFALLWGYVLWLVVQPGAIKRRNIGMTVGFTAIIGVVIVLMLQKLPFISTLYSATEWSFSPVRLVGYVAGVGLVEEGVKLLPVLWLATKMREVRTPREAAFYAGVSGLAFGVAEAVTYSINYTQINEWATMSGVGLGDGNYMLWEFLRLISLPFLHCVFSGIAGYYLGLSLLAPAQRTALLFLGLGLAATVHGLYDFFSGSWLSLVVAAAGILMFVAYLRSAEHITQHITGQAKTTPTAQNPELNPVLDSGQL